MEIIYNLGNKTVLYLIFNRINGFVGSVKRKSETASENTDSQWSNKKLILHVRLRFGSLSITTPVSFLTNEFDVRSILHRQVSLAAVNQIYVIHEAMNGCKNIKIHLRFALKI